MRKLTRICALVVALLLVMAVVAMPSMAAPPERGGGRGGGQSGQCGGGHDGPECKKPECGKPDCGKQDCKKPDCGKQKCKKPDCGKPELKAPPVTIGLDPAWYVYYPMGLKPAADALGMSTEDLSNYLWAGGSLAHLAQLHGVALQDLRNSVDGAMFRLGEGYVQKSPWQAEGMAYPVTFGWGRPSRGGWH
jgi:hypothetical protein